MTSDTPASSISLHLVIHGRVQGVFFRDTMRREAQALSITGWVRNRSDGTVEAVVRGAPSAVNAIVQWAHHGPQHAQVERVDIEPDGGRFTSFDIVA
jgi:acylphosphatase